MAVGAIAHQCIGYIHYKDLSKMDSKYYLCEAENTDEGVNKVTPYDKPEEALEAASNSTAKVHFISTVNPLAVDEEEE
ncbi:MAG TPA: hypothetical protein DEF48_03220 [Nostoc sp. UBA8866]|nr:hypothetical protein [Nostoc sp. UBA8866]